MIPGGGMYILKLHMDHNPQDHNLDPVDLVDFVDLVNPVDPVDPVDFLVL